MLETKRVIVLVHACAPIFLPTHAQADTHAQHTHIHRQIDTAHTHTHRQAGRQADTAQRNATHHNTAHHVHTNAKATNKVW